MLYKLFKISRLFHKYVSLIFLIYFLLMGLSGVLINHPRLIRDISVAEMLIPDSHSMDNGRRMAVRATASSDRHFYLAGRSGVWRTDNSEQGFTSLNNGFPASAWCRETYALHYDQSQDRIFAGTRCGLYSYSDISGRWQQQALGQLHDTAILDLVPVGSQLMIVTEGNLYSATLDAQQLAPATMPLAFDQSASPHRILLIRWLLKLHDGSLLGLPGRLFVDLNGIVLILLCLTGLLFWNPLRKKNHNGDNKALLSRRLLYRLHLDFGSWIVISLLVITISGVLIRPPFLPLIAPFSLPTAAAPLKVRKGDWQPRMSKAVYNTQDDTLLLSTRSGFFSAPADLSHPFRRRRINVPVSAMGTTYFDELTPGRVLVGSFSGLYLWDTVNDRSMAIPAQRNGRARRIMATAVITNHSQPVYAVDYRSGIIPLGNNPALNLSTEIAEAPMSLWHYLFELHNGRIFRQWLGPWTWLLIPVGGALLLLSLLSGIYDWLWHKQYLKRRKP